MTRYARKLILGKKKEAIIRKTMKGVRCMNLGCRTIVLGCLILGLSGCTTRPPNSLTAGGIQKNIIKVAMWGSPKEIKMFENLTVEWERTHPTIDIALEHIPGGNYFNKIQTMIAAGSAPEIIFIEVNDFVPFAEGNLFVPLNEFIADDSQFDINDYFPEVVARFTVNNAIYAIPRDTAPFACIFYNKKLFDAAGLAYPDDDWDMDQFLESSRLLTKTNEKGKIIQWGNYCWAWMNFVYAFGGDLVDDVDNPTRCTLDAPESIAGLQYYSDLMNKHKVSLSPLSLGGIDMSVQQLFMEGRIAMYGSGIWETTQFREGIKDFEWDIAMFPKGPNNVRRFGTGGSGYGILKQKNVYDYKDQWKVLKLLAGKKEQIMLAEAGLAQPAIKQIANSKYWAKNMTIPRNKKMLNDAVRYAVYGPFTARWKEIEQRYIQPELELAFRGKQTIEEAVGKIVLKANKLLSKP